MIATATIKGSLYGSTPIVKRVSAENFVPSKSGPEMAVFRELWGLSVKFLLSNRKKALSCAEPRRLTYYDITSENRFRGLGCGPLQERRKKRSRVNIFDANSRIRGKETPSGIATKFCKWVDIWEIITYATFCDDRLWGLGVTRD